MLQVLWLALVEIIKAILLQVAWKEVASRFVQRLVITGLEKLAKWSSNDVTAQTCNDIVDSLKGKRLSVIDNHPPIAPPQS